MISTIEIINWNITKAFRKARAEKEFENFPFKTFAGLKEDK